MAEEQQLIPKQPNRVGRIQGSKNKFSKDSIRKLAQLGFDPLVQMVNTHKQADQEFRKLTTNKDGTPRVRADGSPAYSTMAVATILAVKQKIENDLIKYRYQKVDDLPGGDGTPPPPMIVLHGPDDAYVPSNGDDPDFEDPDNDDFNETVTAVDQHEDSGNGQSR